MNKDTEILDVIEKNAWAVTPVMGGGYCIEENRATGGDDFQEVELSHEPTLREAVLAAVAVSQ